jgi:hypothetical protein
MRACGDSVMGASLQFGRVDSAKCFLKLSFSFLFLFLFLIN